MERQNYEKPELKFVSLRNQEKVAATCWGNHGKPEEMKYYDTEGNGFLGFYIAEGSCELSLLVVQYYKYYGDPNPKVLPKTDAKYKELYNDLLAAGGDDGNPFHNSGRYPDDPWEFSN